MLELSLLDAGGSVRGCYVLLLGLGQPLTYPLNSMRVTWVVAQPLWRIALRGAIHPLPVADSLARLAGSCGRAVRIGSGLEHARLRCARVAQCVAFAAPVLAGSLKPGL